MISLLVSFLILLLVVCVIAAIVVWIIGNIPGAPPFTRNVVYAIAGLIVLIWLLKNVLPLLGFH